MARQPIIADWSTIKSLYLSGITLKELSQRFGISISTLKSRSYREEWSKVPERFKASPVVSTEKTAAIVTDLWAERGASIREGEFQIAKRLVDYSVEMPEDQLLAKIDKLEIAAKMGRRATGLDREDSNRNAINIQCLGQIDITDSESRLYAKQPVAMEAEIVAENGINEALTE
jgi:lambda repressor-like predicted transcriptional regulator